MHIADEILNKPCDDIRVRRRELFKAAIDVHKREKEDIINSIFLIDALEQDNAAANLGLFKEAFIKKIGLTPDVYYGRVKVGRLFRFHPRALELLEAGETHVSILQMVSGKITEANADVMFQNIKGQSKRDVEGFLSRINPDGSLSESTPTVTIPITLTLEQAALLDRAREVMSSGGHVPTNATLVAAALDALLQQRDPLRKAERAEQRRSRAQKSEAEVPVPEKAPVSEEVQVSEDVAPVQTRPDDWSPQSLENQGQNIRGFVVPVQKPRDPTARPAIPAEIRHKVWLRDQGQCTWRGAEGQRCPERGMLELDHIVMYCRGGGHTVDNLTLRCRHHNQHEARTNLGEDFYLKKQGQKTESLGPACA